MKAKPETERPTVDDCERDPRERVLKSDLPFAEFTRRVLQKKPPAGGWTDQRGEEEEREE